MTSARPLIAIGRSRLLYDTVAHLGDNGYAIKAIVTENPYAEYDVGVTEFQALATSIGAEFFVTKSLDGDAVALPRLVDRYDVEAAISANWRYLITSQVLELFPRGILNLHLGQLPDYKGNATVNWAILRGEDHVYADVHKMAADLDAGDIVARERIDLTENTYVGEVLSRAVAVAPCLFESGLNRIYADPGFVEVPGSPHGLRCFPRLPEDGRIDWTEPAEQICRLVRASSRPYPGAFTFWGERKVTVWRAAVAASSEPFLAVPGHVLTIDPQFGTVDVACSEGRLRLEEVEIDSSSMTPAKAIRSLRTRLGGLPQAPTAHTAVQMQGTPA